MFSMMAPILALVASVAVYVRADPSPTTPSPGSVFIEGGACTVGWHPDPTGLWKDMTIQLMTGDNFNMIALSTVATVDGTDPKNNTFSYTCPKVSPHSAIYFYQFSSSTSSNQTWTGRFAITDSAADVVPPSQSTQSDGEKIPWGVGSLVNGSSSVVPSTAPSTATGPAAVPTAVPTAVPSAVPSPSSAASKPSAASKAAAPSVSNPSSNTSTTDNTVSVAGANGAKTTRPLSSVLFRTVLALWLAAFGFTVML